MEHLKKWLRCPDNLSTPILTNLNPVEMVWKELKKYIANGMYKHVNDMTDAMYEMIQTGTVILPSLPPYALNAME